MASGERDKRDWGICTAAVHAGEGVDPVIRASSPNLVMTSTFRLSPEAERKYRGFAGDSVSHSSAGI